LPDWTDGAVRRLMLDAGDALPDLLDLSRADITSYRQDKVSRAAARINELEARCAWLRDEAERVPLRSPLDGHDLMELFGRGPGPWLRPLKEYLLGLVIDGKLAPDDRVEGERLSAEFLSRNEGTLGEAPPTSAPGQRSSGEPTASKAEARAARRHRSRVGSSAHNGGV
jgi:poly(A) polymerase